MKEKLKSMLKALQPDAEDLHVYGGIALVVAGVAQFSGPAACIVGGGALFWLGVKKP